MSQDLPYWFSYLNPTKVDSLFAQINGSLVKEQTERVSNELKGIGKLGLELGGILAKLGLGKAAADGELSKQYGQLIEITSTLSIENRLKLVLEYYNSAGALQRVDIDNGQLPTDQFVSTRSHDIWICSGVYRFIADGFESKEELGQAFYDSWAYLCYLRDGVKQEGKPAFTAGKLISVKERDGVPLLNIPIFLNNVLPDQNFVTAIAFGLQLNVTGLLTSSSHTYRLDPVCMFS